MPVDHRPVGVTNETQRLTDEQASLCVELLRTAHLARTDATRYNTIHVDNVTARDAAAGRAAAACDAIRGIMTAAGVNLTYLDRWEDEVVKSLGPDPKVSRRLFVGIDEDVRNVFSRYTVVGVVALAGDEIGQFTGIDVWTSAGVERPEVDGIHYRYLHERQEF